MRPTFCVLPLALAALALPAGASAATLGQAPDGAVVFTGGAGGTSLTLGVADDGRIRLSTGLEDEFAAVSGPCEPVEGDPWLALCEVGQGAGLQVQLGDGDDVATVSAPLAVPVIVDGGAGADRLTGAFEGGAETLLGGPGNDSVNGSTGDDVLDGGAGEDTVNGGGGSDVVGGGEGADKLIGDDGPSVDADVIDGGPGHDTLADYSSVGREQLGLVTVTLGSGADDGFSAERDDVQGVERLETHTGGRYAGTDGRDELYVGAEATTVDGRGGDDEIFTSYSADTIDGGAGADTIRGYGGDDRITGGPGADTLFGDTSGQECNVLTCSIHSGNDVIDARDGERDSIDCGLGTDRLLADASDVHSGCEDDQVGAVTTHGTSKPVLTVEPRKLRAALARGLVVRVTGARPGRTVISLRRGRTLVGRAATTVGQDGSARAVVRFRARARKALRRKSSVSLRVTGAGAATIARLGR